MDKPTETLNGWTPPDRIWLHDLGCGDVTWCQDRDPDGEQIEAIEYVRVRSLTTPMIEAPTDAMIEAVARAIARATIEAAEPEKHGRLSERGMSELVEVLAVKFYPEARAAITAMRPLEPAILPTDEQLRALIVEARRSINEVHTLHFNPGVFEHQPPEFEDPDDLFDVLLQRSTKLFATIRALAAERDTAQSLVEAWAEVAEGLEAHIKDRMAMDDPAKPETYLSILQGDVRNVLKSSEQVRAARWTQAKISQDRIDALAAENERLKREQGEAISLLTQISTLGSEGSHLALPWSREYLATLNRTEAHND